MLESRTGLVGLGACRVARCLQGACRANDVDDFPQTRDLAVLNRAPEEQALLGTAAFHGNEQWQGRLAFAKVVTHILAELLRRTLVVQQVVDQLKRRAERASVRGAGFFDVAVCFGQYGAEARAGFEQLRRFES